MLYVDGLLPAKVSGSFKKVGLIFFFRPGTVLSVMIGPESSVTGIAFLRLCRVAKDGSLSSRW